MGKQYSRDDVTFDFVWPSPPQEVQSKAIEFWNLHHAIPTGVDIRERSKQILSVASNAEGEILAVSTAFLQEVPVLEQLFFAYRVFTAPKARLATTSKNQLLFAFEYLGDYAREQDQAAGIYIEVENRELMKRQNEAIWFETRFLYLGKTGKGWHKRVRYFDESVLKQN